jgi:hypothetical protein
MSRRNVVLLEVKERHMGERHTIGLQQTPGGGFVRSVLNGEVHAGVALMASIMSLIGAVERGPEHHIPWCLSYSLE